MTPEDAKTTPLVFRARRPKARVGRHLQYFIQKVMCRIRVIKLT